MWINCARNYKGLYGNSLLNLCICGSTAPEPPPELSLFNMASISESKDVREGGGDVGSAYMCSDVVSSASSVSGVLWSAHVAVVASGRFCFT